MKELEWIKNNEMKYNKKQSEKDEEDRRRGEAATYCVG